MSAQGDDLAKYFAVPNNAFRVVGIDITASVRTICEPWRLIVVVLIAMFTMLCTATYCCKNYANAEMLLNALGILVVEVLTLVKILLFIYKRKSMVSLVKTMKLLSLQASEAEMTLLKQVNSRFGVLSTQYHRLYGVMGFTFLLAPIVATLMIYFKTSEVKLIPAYLGSYPFDVQPPFIYFMIYVGNAIYYHFGCNSIVAINSLFLWFAVNLGAHFRLLQLKLDNLAELYNLDVLADNLAYQKNVAVSLKHCIDFHQKLLAIAVTFKESFELILMVLNILNSIQICLTAYRIGNGTSAAMLPFFVALLLENLAQLMIYCYGGQHLESESGKVVWYFSQNIDWEHWHIRTKKLSLLPLQVAQKPCQLTGVFFDVNYKLFLLILQSSISYITILRSLET